MSKSSSGEEVEKSREGEAAPLREFRILAPIGEERVSREREAIEEGAELLGEARRAGELKGSGRSEKKRGHGRKEGRRDKEKASPLRGEAIASSEARAGARGAGGRAGELLGGVTKSASRHGEGGCSSSGHKHEGDSVGSSLLRRGSGDNPLPIGETTEAETNRAEGEREEGSQNAKASHGNRAKKSEAIARLFAHDAREERGGERLPFGLSQTFTIGAELLEIGEEGLERGRGKPASELLENVREARGGEAELLGSIKKKSSSVGGEHEETIRGGKGGQRSGSRGEARSLEGSREAGEEASASQRGGDR